MASEVEEKPKDFLHEYLQKSILSDAKSLNKFATENQIDREVNETDEAYVKRLKKINYLNLAQELIRQSNQKSSTDQKSNNKNWPPIKRMKPVFSPADEPDFDDQYENDDQTTRDIFDQSSSDEEDELIQPYSHRNSLIKPTHNFANDIKQKLSSLAADVVRTFGNSNSMNDEDLTRPLSVLNESSSKSSSDRNNENDSNKSEISSQREALEEDAELLYSSESLLPQVDWENLERQLKQAQVERERYDAFDEDLDNLRLQLKARLNDRDEVRRKLAAGNESEDENEDYYTSNYLKKTMGTSSHRRRQGSNLQICFVNEHHQANDSNETISTTNTENTKEDIFTKQQRLQEEAKVALVLGAKMARMQVQLERRALKKKKSPLFDMIGISNHADRPLTIRILEDMNIGQLQVIVNDLHSQIEAHNEELVKLLMERDSLSMEQDSILVDIEDLTKRLQECAAESKRAASAQRVYVVKPSPPADVQKKSLLHNLLRKATFI